MRRLLHVNLGHMVFLWTISPECTEEGGARGEVPFLGSAEDASSNYLILVQMNACSCECHSTPPLITRHVNSGCHLESGLYTACYLREVVQQHVYSSILFNFTDKNFGVINETPKASANHMCAINSWLTAVHTSTDWVTSPLLFLKNINWSSQRQQNGTLGTCTV